MWKNITHIVRNVQPHLLSSDSVLINQLRTTFILQRIRPPGPSKLHGKPRKLKSKHFEYALVKDTCMDKSPDIEVILTTYVDGIGDIGDKVKLKSTVAYNKLLLPGFAVYATPETEKQYLKEDTAKKITHSSPFAQRTVNVLHSTLLNVVMSKDVPWTLEPWHIRASFRKAGFQVPEHAISMPNKPIQGPNMNIQNKEFYVTVKVNNMETTNVRCRIHHWTSNIHDRLPYVEHFWKEDVEAIFPEDESILKTIKEDTKAAFKK